MKVTLLVIGKIDTEYLRSGIEIYTKRLSHYCSFSLDVIQDVKNAGSLSKSDLIEKESEMILKRIDSRDHLILLDERGKSMSSKKLAEFFQKHAVNSPEKVVFLVGGAFGVHSDIRARANSVLSVSEMTFSHQMIRLFMLEQIYRAFTITRNENYHNE